MTAARRLVAILVADVARYSRLMGENEAVTARRFANIRGARCSLHARSEKPRQDSRVTVDGRLRVAAGLVAGRHEGRQ
jgi:hypothetical protein